MDRFNTINGKDYQQASLGTPTPALVHKEFVALNLKKLHVWYRDYLDVLDYVLFNFSIFEEHKILTIDEQRRRMNAYEVERRCLAEALNAIGTRFHEIALSPLEAKLISNYFYPKEPLPPSLGMTFVEDSPCSPPPAAQIQNAPPLMIWPKKPLPKSA